MQFEGKEQGMPIHLPRCQNENILKPMWLSTSCHAEGCATFLLQLHISLILVKSGKGRYCGCDSSNDEQIIPKLRGAFL